MNGKKAKQIRNKSLLLLVDWVKTLVSEEEGKKITYENARKLLPTDTHVYANQQIRLSAFTLKWIVKKVKKLIKVKNINDINIKDLNNES
tara:strand:- start:1045 stop:1314 length:270 start_codon:yes stop_codon:yes gene_type:complete